MALALPSAMSVQRKTIRELLAPNGPVFKTLQAVGRRMPMLAKWSAILLFLINVKSWPLMWHFRVFQTVFQIRAKHQLLLWRSMFWSKEARAKLIDQWLDTLTPIGENPFDQLSVYKMRATIDDCDFNGHLSNSSYAKTIDSARFNMAIAMAPMFFRAGGWMALGGTHFMYLREIPMMAKYEVRSTMAAWDQKWVFAIHRFVTKPKGKKSKKKTTESPSKQNGTPDQTVQNILHASLRTPADTAMSDVNSPFSSTPVDSTAAQETSAALKAAAAGLASTEEPDGSIVHAIAISEVCFKMGRITVPPTLSLAANGLSAPPSEFGSSLAKYSRTNPPPHWAKAKAIMSIPLGGSTKALKELFVGGWRNVPEEERWWDKALSGVVEERRKAGLEVVGGLRSGMEGAKTLI